MILYSRLTGFSTSFWVLIVVFLIGNPDCHADESFLERQFILEAPLQWQRLKEKYDTFLQSTNGFSVETERITTREQSGVAKTGSRELIFQQQIGQDYAIFERVFEVYRNPGERYDRFVSGVNPKYQFKITQQSAKASPTLDELLARRESKAGGRVEDIWEYMGYPPNTFTSYFKYNGENPIIRSPLTTWSELDGMKILESQKIQYKGQEAVQLEIEYDYLNEFVTENHTLVQRLDRYRLVAIFNHKDFWTLLEVAGGNHRRYQKISYEYQKIDGIPFVQSVQLEVTSELDDDFGKLGISLVNRFNDKRIRKRDFTVLAFGFPEPSAFSTQSANGLNIWVGALMSLGFIICLYLYSRSRFFDKQ